jgi:hypothetical protein
VKSGLNWGGWSASGLHCWIGPERIHARRRKVWAVDCEWTRYEEIDNAAMN